MSKKSAQSSGSGTSMVLFIVFLILKLTNVIDWSWWWVTCPLWIGLAIVLAMMAIAGIIGLIINSFK